MGLLCTGRVFGPDRSSGLLGKACQGASQAGRRGSSQSSKTILASGYVVFLTTQLNTCSMKQACDPETGRGGLSESPWLTNCHEGYQSQVVVDHKSLAAMHYLLLNKQCTLYKRLSPSPVPRPLHEGFGHESSLPSRTYHLPFK